MTRDDTLKEALEKTKGRLINYKTI